MDVNGLKNTEAIYLKICSDKCMLFVPPFSRHIFCFCDGPGTTLGSEAEESTKGRSLCSHRASQVHKEDKRTANRAHRYECYEEILTLKYNDLAPRLQGGSSLLK